MLNISYHLNCVMLFSCDFMHRNFKYSNVCSRRYPSNSYESDDEDSDDDPSPDHDYDLQCLTGKKFINKGRWTKGEVWLSLIILVYSDCTICSANNATAN